MVLLKVAFVAWIGLNATAFGLMMWIMFTARSRWGGLIYPELHEGLYGEEMVQWKKILFDVLITVFFLPAFVAYYALIVTFGLIVALVVNVIDRAKKD